MKDNSRYTLRIRRDKQTLGWRWEVLPPGGPRPVAKGWRRTKPEAEKIGGAILSDYEGSK